MTCECENHILLHIPVRSLVNIIRQYTVEYSGTKISEWLNIHGEYSPLGFWQCSIRYSPQGRFISYGAEYDDRVHEIREHDDVIKYFQTDITEDDIPDGWRYWDKSEVITFIHDLGKGIEREVVPRCH